MNKRFKSSVLFAAMALSFSATTIANEAAKIEETNIITMEEAVSDVSTTFDKVASDLSTFWEEAMGTSEVDAENKGTTSGETAAAPSMFDKMMSDISASVAKVRSENQKSDMLEKSEPQQVSNSCKPFIQVDFLTDPLYLTMKTAKNSFRIDNNGQLFSDVGTYDLTEQQRSVLREYQKTIRDDLLFLHGQMNTEITKTWKVFDQLFAEELGENSKLRNELSQIHDKLMLDITKAYYIEGDKIHFDHQIINSVIEDFEKSIPSFIANVSIKGFSDITSLSSGQDSRFSFIASKVKTLKNEFVADLREQRTRIRGVRSHICARFNIWQQNEDAVKSLIPALSNWQSIRFEQKS